MTPTALLFLMVMLGNLLIVRVEAEAKQNGKNIALWASTSQSTTGYGGPANKAVNGDMSTNHNSRPCTHTALEDNPWWRVDLGKVFNITRVAITNRGDCCPERLNGAEIRIGNSLENNGNSNSLASFIRSIPRGQTWTFHLYPMEGRYVNVYLPGKDKYLTLCEVQVFADDPREAGFLHEKKLMRNLALKGRATQSSLQISGTLAGIGMAQNAIDGNRNPDPMKGSCSMTAQESSPWWRVNLHRIYTIVSVALTNRADCCPEGLSGAEIRVGNSLENEGRNNTLCATVSFIPAGQTAYFNCDEMLKGRYVTVVLPREGSLSLCEVEVLQLPVGKQRA